MAQNGDIVKVSKSIMGRSYQTTGKVTATQWDRVHDCQMVQVGGDWWFTINDLENAFTLVESTDKPIEQPIAPSQQTEYDTDFDRGFGIGGLGRFQETPTIPTPEQMERIEKMMARATACRRCGQNDVFDGAMFTTVGGNICDDCCG